MEGAVPHKMPDAGASSIDAMGTGTVAAPTLGPLPETTYWNSIPIQGHGPGGGTILIQSDTGTTLTQMIQPSGDFCVAAPLRKSAVTTFTLRAQDADGNLSDAIQAQVRQSGTPPPPPQPGPSRNIATGGTPANNMYVSGGTPNNMIDGDLSTWLAGWDWSWGSDWVWVQLAERSSVVAARVYSSPDCTTVAYALLLLDHDAPGDPSESNANWFRVADVTAGTGADALTFQPATAKHMAVFFKDGGCGFTGVQKHRIAELQMWTQPDQPPPPPTAPTCSGGAQ
jgi:hypothetical protein